MRNKVLAAIAAGFIATVGVAAPAQAISPTTADLYVLHAVPDLTVDVWVNGAVLLEDFAPGTLTDPLLEVVMKKLFAHESTHRRAMQETAADGTAFSSFTRADDETIR